MIDITNITDDEVTKVLNLNEGHFGDLKSRRISPSALSKTISAFSNADGGDLYIGIEDSPRIWDGFPDQESANGYIQLFEELFPLGDGYTYTFLENGTHTGLVLKVDVEKNRAIKYASDGVAYLRRGAQKLPVKEIDAIKRLERNKGLTSFETELVNVETDVIENSEKIIEFMLEVVPSSEPEGWLRKQRLIVGDKPSVGGVLLFAEEPQALIPKHCGLKIYQYKTKEEEGSREELLFDPITVEGCLYDAISQAVGKTVEIMESIRIMTPKGLQKVSYPRNALHEIVTNAVLHRDYSIADDIHIRIFDNRIEVQSPGTLPAHITTENILSERFARNGAVVRLINKFPNPPNKDVGEGLNTAFHSMNEMRLKEPTIELKDSNVLVTLKHEMLGTPQELIMEYLEVHDTIRNRDARELCSIPSENAMKHILRRMVNSGMLEVIEGATRFQTSYKRSERA